MTDLERIRKMAYDIEQEANKGTLKDSNEAIAILAECIERLTDILHGMQCQYKSKRLTVQS